VQQQSVGTIKVGKCDLSDSERLPGPANSPGDQETSRRCWTIAQNVNRTPAETRRERPNRNYSAWATVGEATGREIGKTTLGDVEDARSEVVLVGPAAGS
jgi:hypothetical protein